MTDLRGLVDALARRSRGGLAATAALGGLALIAGLAYRASTAETGARTPDLKDLNEDDAETILRAMIAATVADGAVDAQERRRLDEAVAAAGLGLDERRWLDQQLADPPRVDEIVDRVGSPDLAARVYAAARIAIEPDTLQERHFLKDLAESLDLAPEVTQRIETELSVR